MNLVIILPCIYYATAKYGSIGAANAMTLVLLAFLPIYYGIAARAIGLDWRDVLKIFSRPALSTLTMYLVVDFLFRGAPSSGTNLVLAIITGAALYVALAIVLWTIVGKPRNCGEAFLLDQLRSRLRRAKTA